ncbi:MAG: YggS family pyridoxal phosphate-dependent enzyme [Planctomycetota bacterium]
MVDPQELADRYSEVKGRVADAALRAGRDPDRTILVAVTKYAEPEDIRRLMEMGHADFGENRVQQLVQRAAMAKEWLERARVLEETRALREARVPARSSETDGGGGVATGPETTGELTPDQAIRWHMIGHLQRNKAKKVLPEIRLVHSVDSLRLAEELQSFLVNGEQQIDVLLQVNCSGEESKYGCHVPAAMPLAEQIDQMYSVRLRGVMTMAPYSDNPEDARPVFARCRELFDEIKKLGVGDGRFNLLSMGMSGDYEVAIEEGANVVRVGSAIFGQREVEGG